MPILADSGSGYGLCQGDHASFQAEAWYSRGHDAEHGTSNRAVGGELESALQLYRSAYVLAREVNKTDLAVVAESGVRRLNGKVGIQAIRPEPRAVANVSSAKPKTR